MKLLLSLILLTTSVSLFAQSTTTGTKKVKKVETKKVTTEEVKGLEDLPKKNAEPCDTKEDILKKLEEEKKKKKAFSLQGGDTGCSVDKK